MVVLRDVNVKSVDLAISWMPCAGDVSITNQSRHTEPIANSALGRVLAGMLPTCNVRHEDTGVIVGSAGLHPDILITASDRAPVVIEAEYHPANSVEDDALMRLGLIVEDGHRRIESAIALRYPEALKYAVDLDTDVRRARLSYAVLYENGDRFPASGWLEGSCEDVADMARLLSVPQSAVNEASDHLELGIETAADRLNEISELRPKVAWEIAGLLGMSNVHQTRRMACAILANAMVFHDRVADMHDGVEHLHMVCGPEIADPQAEVLASWRDDSGDQLLADLRDRARHSQPCRLKTRLGFCESCARRRARFRRRVRTSRMI